MREADLNTNGVEQSVELVVGEMNSRLQTDQLKLVKDKYAFRKLTNMLFKN